MPSTKHLIGTTVEVSGRTIEIIGSGDGYSHANFKRKQIALTINPNFVQATLEHEIFHFKQHYDWVAKFAKFFYSLPFFPKDQWSFLVECAAYAHASKYIAVNTGLKQNRESEIIRYGIALSEYKDIDRTAAECEKQIRKKIKEGGLF